MSEALFWLLLLLLLVSIVLLVFILYRLPRSEKISALRDELRAGREETSQAARDSRDELSKNLREANATLSNTLTSMAAVQRAQLDGMTEQVQKLAESHYDSSERLRDVLESRIKNLQASNEQKLEHMSCTLEQKAEANREELSRGLKTANETLATTLMRIGEFQTTQLEAMTTQCKEIRESNGISLDRIRISIGSQFQELQHSNDAKIGEIRNTLAERLAQNREELSQGLTSANETLSMNLQHIAEAQRMQRDSMTKELKELTESNQNSLDRVRLTLDSRVKELQDNNDKKLEHMRRTVDEKLHETLEKRLGASFTMVSERLEAVQRGLGEMQNLAAGVGDLQRVLTNVKVRGTWAEVQLGGLLDQILAPGQYEKNVRVKPDSNESVEYAVCLPGKKDDPSGRVWLPIDSKFPQEAYRRLQEAADRADPEATRKAADELFRAIRAAAKQINEKYINPPTTTDFAIMFLATEGLYGEALRDPSLVEDLQRRYRIVIAGPTTLAAILNSLRMGFQTLAIEKRASEVMKVLGAVKTEFGKFGEVLDKVKRQLNLTTRTIEETGVRTRAIERSLRSVEELPELEASAVLQISHSEMTPEIGEVDECEVIALANTE
jgi:DNA recombination protein RmuC